MKPIEGQFYHGRRRIFYQAWLPSMAIKSVLVIVHGLGEHSGRYARLAGHFTALGHAVYGFDLIGHGRSEGLREYVDDFSDFTDPLAAYCRQISIWHQGTPLFVIGHSMGSLIAARCLLDGGIDPVGVIFSAPSIKADDSVSKVVIWVGKCLAVIAPKFRIMSLDSSSISRDPDVLAACRNDPLVYPGKLTAKLGAELLKAMREVQTRVADLNVPMLVLQGGGDRIVNPAGAIWLHENAGSIKKTLKIYPHLYHEVFNEPEYALVFKDVETWLADFV